MGTLALIGLGSNLGDRRAILDAAIAALAETPGVVVRAVSTYHETAPIGGPEGQGPFLNAAAALVTTHEPDALHVRLKAIEHDAGRVRGVRWGERTLDLDLLLFGERIIETPELTVPHPRMAVRRFVLAPLAEIAPDAVHSVIGWPIARLLAHLDRRPGCVTLSKMDELGPAVFARLVSELDAVPIGDGTGLALGEIEATLPARGSPDLEKGVERAFSEGLTALIDRLARPSWPASAVGERWLVTDAWIDDLDVLVRGRLGPQGRNGRERADHPWYRLRAARELVVEPTFLVLHPRRHLFMFADIWTRRNRPLYDLPYLRPSTEDAAAISAEVVAACAASRVGS